MPNEHDFLTYFYCLSSSNSLIQGDGILIYDSTIDLVDINFNRDALRSLVSTLTCDTASVFSTTLFVSHKRAVLFFNGYCVEEYIAGMS
jgi:hypothetical protein